MLEISCIAISCCGEQHTDYRQKINDILGPISTLRMRWRFFIKIGGQKIIGAPRRLNRFWVFPLPPLNKGRGWVTGSCNVVEAASRLCRA
jgi:hypothetical protein